MTDTEAEARDYEVLADDGEQVDRFRTGPAGGRSADENAVGNLLDHSQFNDGRFLLRLLLDTGAVPLAHARDGVGELLVDADSLSADSMYGSQLGWAGTTALYAAASRRRPPARIA